MELYLIDDSDILSLSGNSWYNTELSKPLEEDDYKNYGFENIEDISEDLWEEVKDGVLLMWTDSSSTSANIDYNTEEHTPLEKLDTTTPELLIYSDDDSLNPTMELTVEDYDKQTKSISFTDLHYRDEIDLSDQFFYIEDQIKIIAEDVNSGTAEEIVDAVVPSGMIIDPDIHPEDIHDEKVYLEADLDVDKNNVYKIRYKVEKDDETIRDWSDYQEVPYELDLSWLHDEFDIGTNYITLTIETDGGQITDWEGDVTKNNAHPVVTGNLFRLTFSGNIDDPDEDRVKYYLSINDVQKYPESGYTDFEEVPYDFEYKFKSTDDDVVVGSSNTIRIDYEDSLGETGHWEKDFVPEYQNIMFLDEDSEFYSDDEGNTFKHFDFGVVTAGADSSAQKIYLQNLTGVDLKNLEIWVDTSSLPDGVDVQLSHDNSEYEHKLIFNGTYEDEDEDEFYIKMFTETSASGSGTFKIKARAEEVE